MKFWPSRKNDIRSKDIKTFLRDMDISLDEWASYFTFNGNTYPSNSFDGGSLYAFGGYPADSSTGKTEEPQPDYIGMVNGAYKASGAVFACSLARQMLFAEARFAFQSFDGTRPGDLVPGDGLELLQHPWPGAVTSTLLSRAIQDADLAGNAYFVRQHDKTGDRLRRLRPDWVMILMDGDPLKDAYVDVVAYIYKPGNTSDAKRWEIFPVDGSNGLVAHWAPIPDPDVLYRGMSWMTPIINEIQADKAIATHKTQFFKNGATPGIIVSYDVSVEPEQCAEFTEKFKQTKLGVGNAYRPMFLGGGSTVTTVGSKVEDFKDISSVGELRIAAAARVPPTVVGLSESLKGSALTQGNYLAAKEQFASGTIRPLWGSLCAALEPLIDLPANTRLWYDDRDIAFLREDQKVVADRQQIEATTIARLVQDGFTAESSVQALIKNDWKLLEHTGLYSVQLLPPGVAHAQGFSGDDTATAEQEKQDAAAAAKDPGSASTKKAVPNNYSTGSTKKPPGRPAKPGA